MLGQKVISNAHFTTTYMRARTYVRTQVDHEVVVHYRWIYVYHSRRNHTSHTRTHLKDVGDRVVEDVLLGAWRSKHLGKVKLVASVG